MHLPLPAPSVITTFANCPHRLLILVSDLNSGHRRTSGTVGLSVGLSVGLPRFSNIRVPLHQNQGSCARGRPCWNHGGCKRTLRKVQLPQLTSSKASFIKQLSLGFCDRRVQCGNWGTMQMEEVWKGPGRSRIHCGSGRKLGILSILISHSRRQILMGFLLQVQGTVSDGPENPIWTLVQLQSCQMNIYCDHLLTDL